MKMFFQVKFTVIYRADAEQKSYKIVSVSNLSFVILAHHGNSRVLSIHRVRLADVDPR